MSVAELIAKLQKQVSFERKKVRPKTPKTPRKCRVYCTKRQPSIGLVNTWTVSYQAAKTNTIKFETKSSVKENNSKQKCGFLKLSKNKGKIL